MTKRSTATYDDQQQADVVLIDFVLQLGQRIVAASDIGQAVVRHDDLDDALRNAHPAVADAALPVVVSLLGSYRTRLETARERLGSMPLIGQVIAGRLSDVFSAVDRALVDPAVAQAITEAENAVAEVERQREEALAKLEAAVSRADIDTVLALRPEVEVAIPARLGTARLQVLDAKLGQHRAVIAAGERRARVAKRRVLDAETAVAEARELLARAEASHAAVATLARDATSAATVATEALHTAERERATAAARFEADSTTRFRRLAGLDGAPAVPTIPTAPKPVVIEAFARDANFVPVVTGNAYDGARS